jgi:hypothetical protein
MSLLKRTLGFLGANSDEDLESLKVKKVKKIKAKPVALNQLDDTSSVEPKIQAGSYILPKKVVRKRLDDAGSWKD